MTIPPPAGGNNLRTTVLNDGKLVDVPDYATVQGILLGVVAGFLILCTIIGPENHGSHFEKAKAAFEEGAGEDEVAPDADAAPRGDLESDMSSRPRSIVEVREKDFD